MSTFPILDDIIRNSSVDVNLAAYHWNRDKQKILDYNEVNPGIGITYTDGDTHYMAGQYLNSLRHNSNYALVGKTLLDTNTAIGKFGLGVVGGAITGYPLADVIPAAGILGTWDSKDFGLNLIATPNVKVGNKDVDGFLGLQGRYKFK